MLPFATVPSIVLGSIPPNGLASLIALKLHGMSARARMRTVCTTAFALLTFTSGANALPDDYLDETLSYRTAQFHELDGEATFDYGRFASDTETTKSRNFFRERVSLEYGITKRWMIEARTSVVQSRGPDFHFDSANFETRFRFAETSVWPVDVAASGEFHVVREIPSHRIASAIEPRLILSRDFGPLNVTGNISWEVPLSRSSGSANMALGVLYELIPERLHVGTELKYDGRDKSARAVPQFFIRLNKHLLVKTGAAFPVHTRGERFFRTSLARLLALRPTSVIASVILL